MFLLPLLACATIPKPPLTIGIPVTPSPYSVGPSSFGVGVPLPKAASLDAPWVSSDPRVSCDGLHGCVNVKFAIPTRADWPYTLPTEVTCRQGEVVVTVPLDFTAPSAGAWIAADGALVVPHHAHETVAGVAPAPIPGLRAARVEPAVDGFTCGVDDQGGVRTVRYQVDLASAASAATCRLELEDGSVREQPIVAVVY
jgi:hypothetical protein